MKRFPFRSLQPSVLDRAAVVLPVVLVTVLAFMDAPRSAILVCGAIALLVGLSWAGRRESGHASSAPGETPAGERPVPEPISICRDPLVGNLPALVWLTGPDGRVADENRRARDYVGTGSGDRADLATLLHESERDGFAVEARAASPDRREFHLQARLRRHDGVFRWHYLIGSPFRREGEASDAWLVTAIDIEPIKIAQESQFRRNLNLRSQVAATAERLSEATIARENTERQLRHTQKMDAVSRLAAGIAHDLNNKLIVIGANIDAVVKHLKEAPQLRRKLLSALVASEQAAELMSKLLAFARQQDQKPRYIDVAEHLASVCRLLERSFLSDSVAVRLEIPADLWAVEADPEALETAIVNLAVNARDAMGEGGTILIEASHATLPRTRPGGPGLAGDFVRIMVSDSGRGIPPEHLDRVFEPFFTTKEPARFTGLGLSQVHDFAEGVGGTVEVASRVGKGTSVSMFLPRAELRARIGVPPAFEDLTEDEEASRPGTNILIVDDEVEVALALQAMLVELGYEPRIAIGADEAMAEIDVSRPALVLTDVTMPGAMDGVALGREIRKAHPDLPVVLLTGNPTVVATDSGFPLIQKPIASRTLNAVLQRHLAPEPDEKVVSLFGNERRRAGGPAGS